MPISRKRPLLVALVVLLWLGATGWLVFYEAYPELLNRTTPGYRTLLAHGVMVMDRWMKISTQGKSIGYTHTSIDVNDNTLTNQYRIKNHTILSLSIMGSRQRVAVNADAVVDAQYTLQSFDFELTSTGNAITVTGNRKHGALFDITITGLGPTQRLSITIPDDAILYSPMTGMMMKTLTPGKQTVLRIFNPVTMSPQNVTLRALRRESIRQGHDTIEATVLSAQMDGMETLSWIDADGDMLKQETPFGWTIERCSAKEALAAGVLSKSGNTLTAGAFSLMTRGLMTLSTNDWNGILQKKDHDDNP
ncbi:MAG: hypothetical protein WCO42_05490 [bacterium]